MCIRDSASHDIGLNNLINLGFGGATVPACRIYLKRLVLKYYPKHLIIYAGDNDIGSGVKPENALNEFSIFMAEIDELLPKTICYFISIKPSPFRIPYLQNISVFNEKVKHMIAAKSNWKFIDLFNPKLDNLGMPSTCFYLSLIHI